MSKKQKISFKKMSLRANKFANEMVESFDKNFEMLLDRRLYNWEYKILHDWLLERAIVVLHKQFSIVRKNKKTKRA